MTIDAISRQAVHETIEKWAGSMDVLIALPTREIEPLLESIHKLPPVTPISKTGKWKAFTHSAYHGNDEDGEPIWREVTVYHCNLCNRRTVIKENYCPNCGARMQEVEE